MSATSASLEQHGQISCVGHPPSQNRTPSSDPHRLLATGTNRHGRNRVLDAVTAWGHDTSDLRTTSQPAKLNARRMAERHPLITQRAHTTQAVPGPEVVNTKHTGASLAP